MRLFAVGTRRRSGFFASTTSVPNRFDTVCPATVRNFGPLIWYACKWSASSGADGSAPATLVGVQRLFDFRTSTVADRKRSTRLTPATGANLAAGLIR